MTEIRYTLDPKSTISTIALSAWVRLKMGTGYSATNCLTVARCLKSGQGWEPPYCAMFEPEAPGPCEFVVTEPVNEYAEYQNKQQALYDLKVRGASGDAEAAIAYCKADLDGKVNHGPMAG